MLLVVAALGLGSTSAWADAGDVTTNVNLIFNGSATFANPYTYTKGEGEVCASASGQAWNDGGNPKTIGLVLNTDGHLSMSNGNMTIGFDGDAAGDKDIVEISFDLAYPYVYSSSTDRELQFVISAGNTAVVTERYNFNKGTIPSSTMGMTVDYLYKNGSTTLWGNKVHFTLTFNYATQKIVMTTACSSATKTEGEFEIDMPENTGAVTKFYISMGSANANAGRYALFDNLLVQTTEGDYSTTKTITYAYEDNNGNDITDLVVAKGGTASATPEVGDTYTPVYLSSFIDDEWAYDYTYTSGGDSFTVTDDETITIVYNKTAHATADVTVQYKNGDDVLKEDLIAEDYPVGKSITYYVRKYVLSGGTLYQSASGTSRSVAAASTIEESVSSSGITNVVFFSEGEECSNKTGTASSTVASRQQMGRFSGDCNISNLEKGIYQINAMIHVGNGSDSSADYGTATFTAGGFTGTKTVKQRTNNQSYTSDNFTLARNTDVTLNFGGGNASGVDYIYIVKIDEYYYESMSIVGDFSANAWDATGGIEMTQDPLNPYVWTAVVKDFVITSAKYNYNYKAVADENYSVYELPSGYEVYQNYDFDYAEAGEGVYTLTFTVNTSTHSVSMVPTKQKTATVYFVNKNDWSTPKAWVWDSTNSNYNYTGGDWPGQTMTPTGTQIDGKDVYEWSTYDITGAPNYVIFSDNGSNQTSDLSFINGFTYNPSGDMTVAKTITAAGWATFCSPYALDFSGDIENLEAAYIVTGGAAGVLTKTEMTGTVPANTGLLLKGEGAVAIPVVASSSTDVSANKLVGKTAEYELAAEGGYVLMASPSLGFYKNSNAFTIGANTAYLPAGFDAGASRFFLIEGDDQTTGIVSAMKQQNTGQVFDLQGRRVAQPTKGLYIINGKKVVVK